MPNTDPNAWFLPAKEVPRSPHFTSGNEVRALLEGESYYSHLCDRMAAMKSGEYLHLAGWRVSPSILLKPATSPPSIGFLDQVKDLIGRGVVVRALLWYFPTSIFNVLYRPIPLARLNHVKDNVDFVDGVNAASAGGTSAAVLDQRLAYLSPYAPTTLASHHQKTLILAAEGHHWAYLGSIDLAVDRWDTDGHDNAPGRQKEYWDAYHDIQCVLRGPVVGQIWETFTDRWNDTTPASKWFSPAPRNPPSPIKGKAPSQASYGSQHVQLLRTLACRSTYPFAPSGEQTPRKALERAIDNAEHFIYIEEQFLWPCSLVDRLAAAIARNRHLRVVMVTARDLEFGGPLGTTHHEMRNECTRAITGSSTGQFFIYHLEQLGTGQSIYVHPKLILIDDCFVGIGSANINKRSLTTDTELHLGIVDGKIVDGVINGAKVSVCDFARSLRMNLWMEHLGITDPARVEDPIAAIALWPDWAKSKPLAPSRVHHAVCHHPRTEVASAMEWLLILRALRILFPRLPPPFDALNLDALIATLEAMSATLLASGLDLTTLLGGWQLYLLKRLLRELVMNIETTC